MMKKILAGAALLGCLFQAHAQDATKPKLSAFTQRYLAAAGQQQGNTRVPGYVYKKINGKAYISALIKVAGNIDESKLTALGVYTGTKAGSVWTVQIPLEQVSAFSMLPGISYIGLDVPILPSLDSARKQTHADSAQK